MKNLGKHILLLLLWQWMRSIVRAQVNLPDDDTGNITFLLLRGKNDFFDPIEQGFLNACQEQQEKENHFYLDCHVRTYAGQCSDERLQNLQALLQELAPQGLAINTKCQQPPFLKYLQNFTAHGASLVTYGKDLPQNETGRITFIGTDESFMGRTVARLLRQLRPEGGTFAVVGYKQERTEAFLAEIEKYNALPGRAHWHEVPRPTKERTNVEELFYEELHNYSLLDPTAIVTLMQSPMRVDWPKLMEEHAHRNITYVGVDAADYQLDYLNRKLVHGLVGQLPHEIGVACFESLYRHVIWKREKGRPMELEDVVAFPDRIRTNLVSYNIIPLELPPLAVDENLLGSLAWLGWIFFAIVAASVVYCILWTLRYRRLDAVVRAAQPGFLIMIAVGVLILAASLIPLSFDDGGDSGQSQGEHYVSSTVGEFSEAFRVGLCMSVPWLAFTGFTIIFSALFAKTWRVNRIVRGVMLPSNGNQERAQIANERDVLVPFAFLLTCNWAILLAWTLWEPLSYSRLELEGTDYWNRVIATYGGCHSDHAAAFLIPLGILNFAGVVLSCWQAFQARNIVSEFSEARYIGLTVGSLCQGFLTGVPVVVVVREMPRAYYVVLSLTIFLLSMAVLGLIFGPKIAMQKRYLGKSPAEQARILRQAVMGNSDSGSRSHTGSGVVASVKSSAWSSDVAYRSDHRRFNEPTASSIPENQVVVDEDSGDEYDRTCRFTVSSAVDTNVSTVLHGTEANRTTSTVSENDSDLNSHREGSKATDASATHPNDSGRVSTD